MARPSTYTPEEDKIILETAGMPYETVKVLLETAGFSARDARKIATRRNYLTKGSRSQPKTLAGLEQRIRAKIRERDAAAKTVDSLNKEISVLRSTLVEMASGIAA